MEERSAVAEQLDMLGHSTGVEKEELAATTGEKIAEPFDPDDIDVVTRSMTVDLLLSRAKSDMIDLQPDFQRRWGIWDTRRQSRLIESLLLRIPLPVIYAAEDDDERWEIVDGIQRLTTIARFVKPEIVKSIKPQNVDIKPLVLTDLEYLRDYENKNFEQLSSRMQMRLRETELIIHLIRKGTPPEVKFNIFARINTGGVALSAQELRHAITPGKAREVLENWSNLFSFVHATDGSVQPTRMDDRELVLRFIAFFLLGTGSYKQPDMDGFLLGAMKAINNTVDGDLAAIQSKFEAAMDAAFAIFGPDSFRKRFDKIAGRMPINKAIFEAMSVNLARLTQEQIVILKDRKELMQEGFIALCHERTFEAAISQGTGDIRKVNRRFSAINELITKSLSNA